MTVFRALIEAHVKMHRGTPLNVIAPKGLLDLAADYPKVTVYNVLVVSHNISVKWKDCNSDPWQFHGSCVTSG